MDIFSLFKDEDEISDYMRILKDKGYICENHIDKDFSLFFKRLNKSNCYYGTDICTSIIIFTTHIINLNWDKNGVDQSPLSFDSDFNSYIQNIYTDSKNSMPFQIILSYYSAQSLLCNKLYLYSQYYSSMNRDTYLCDENGWYIPDYDVFAQPQSLTKCNYYTKKGAQDKNATKKISKIKSNIFIPLINYSEESRAENLLPAYCINGVCESFSVNKVL